MTRRARGTAQLLAVGPGAARRARLGDPPEGGPRPVLRTRRGSRFPARTSEDTDEYGITPEKTQERHISA
ncbi:hypothetical protein GCM10027294_50870 [Marinactinospora endophytica]